MPPRSTSASYRPATWEKVCGMIAAFWILGLASYLIIRNQPLDPDIAVIMRIILSLGISIFGAVIPGFLKVDLTSSGIAIRAGGALALFVLCFFFTPKVFQKAFADELPLPWENSQTGMPQMNADFIRLMKSTSDRRVVKEELLRLKQPQIDLISVMKAAEFNSAQLQRPSKLIALHNYLAMANYQLASIANFCEKLENDGATRSKLRNEAIEHAKLAVDYSRKGKALSDALLNSDGKTFSKEFAAWTTGSCKEAQKILRDSHLALGLQWHKAAGTAILAYYDQVPFVEAFDEVQKLKLICNIKDPPEDDPSMKWVLSSNNGTRPI